MVLITPHLKMLAKCWEAAVRDYAILTLPLQFSTQLPSKGTYFTSDSAEAVLPCFNECWYVLLHAAILWEGQLGLLAKEVPPTQPESAFPLPITGNETKEMYSLFLGLIVQGLCNPNFSEETSILQSLLHSLYSLLAAKWSRGYVPTSPIVVVELLGVLHRMLLTCKNRALHQDIVATAVLIRKILMENSIESHFEDITKGFMRIIGVILLPWLPEDGHKMDSQTLSPEDKMILPKAISLLSNVVQFSAAVDRLENSMCVVYLLLKCAAHPNVYASCKSDILLALQYTLAVDTEEKQQIVASAILSLIGNSSSSADSAISGMNKDTKLILLAMLLHSSDLSQPEVSGEVVRAVEYVAKCTEEDPKVSAVQGT